MIRVREGVRDGMHTPHGPSLVYQTIDQSIMSVTSGTDNLLYTESFILLLAELEIQLTIYLLSASQSGKQ